MYITAKAPVSEMTYTVSSGTLNHTMPADQMYVTTDMRQTSDIETDVRQHHCSMPRGRGHKNGNLQKYKARKFLEEMEKKKNMNRKAYNSYYRQDCREVANCRY